LRLDVSGKPENAYDLKTGNAKLTPGRVEEIRDATNKPGLPIYEIRPQVEK